MRARVCGVLLAGLVAVGSAAAQDIVRADEAFSRKNAWTVFAEYSNTSSHILMGASDHRILTDLGFAYTRRLWRFWGASFSYQAEVRPVLFESDPVANYYTNVTIPGGLISGPTLTYSGSGTTTEAVDNCTPYSTSATIPPIPPSFPGETYSTTVSCGRQWTFGQAFAPVGFKIAMRTRKPLQPFVIGTLGYMYTSRPVPVSNAESFNFAFDFGAGVELFRVGGRSVSVEARYHHFSNKNTAAVNPGVDNVMYKVSYSFGR
jgi:opacity protein-like surface antigen